MNNEYRRELFLKLQGETAKTFKEYADAILAYNNSNSDTRLKEIMDEKNTAYQMAFSNFQSYFPESSI
jgi:hypothetical protein